MRVVTINLGSRPDTEVLHGLIRLAEFTDVIGVQEAGDRRAVLNKFASVTGWHVIQGSDQGRSKVALLCKAWPEAWDYFPCTARTYVGPKGAGPEWISPKWVVWARFAGVTVGVTHLVPSVQRLPFPGRERRRELYRKHIRACVDWCEQNRGPVVLVGDFNATVRFRLLEPLKAAGLTPHTKPSHGGRAIDYLWTRGLRVGDVNAANFPSDHKAVWADLDIPEAPVKAPTITQQVTAAAKKRGVTVYTRRQWGSREGDVYALRRRERPHSILPDNPVDTMWQHITVTNPSGDIKADARVIERIGMERFGSGVSYNWLVDMTTGEVCAGQPLDAKGTHTVNDKGARTPSGETLSYDQNKVALAVAVVGMPGTKLSAKAEASITNLLLAHIDAGALTKGFDYLPHSHVAYKDCPCDPTRNRMDEIRAAVRKAL